ncbi:hypothetical protein PIB30_112769 [Stylosanthes scabra]|uniref:Uncharacterized protein n=1 Tax=Stylosanthes scabra TaxID=79078 RepID=A0ABU6T1G2_9FABA|nr:hypothetical protein [Stylosanthes scabra]
MEFTSCLLEIIPVEDPTVPPDFRFSDCFSINFTCIKELIQVTQPTNPTSDDIDFSSSSTTFNEAFLVPSYILCNCTPLTDSNVENAELLHEIFSSVPISSELLDEILPHLEENTRVILSHEGCDSLVEMDVNLHVLTVIADEDFDL